MSIGKGIVACGLGVGTTVIASRHMDVAGTAFPIEGVPIPWVVVILGSTIIVALVLMRGK